MERPAAGHAAERLDDRRTRPWPKGALLAVGLDDFRAGKRDFTMLFEPTPTTSLAGTSGLKSALVMNVLDNVRTTGSPPGRSRTRSGPRSRSLGVGASRSEHALGVGGRRRWLDRRLLDGTRRGSSSPRRDHRSARFGQAGGQPIKKSPAFFDASGLVVEQRTSRGRRTAPPFPCFQILRDHLALDGLAPDGPVRLWRLRDLADAGLRCEVAPGAAWEERGGVYVLANIRAEQVQAGSTGRRGIRRRSSTSAQNATTTSSRSWRISIAAHGRPRRRRTASTEGRTACLLDGGKRCSPSGRISSAPSCAAAPLLDMKRYHKSSRARRMENMANPEEARRKIGPRSVGACAVPEPARGGTKYPRTLFTSSTRDDRRCRPWPYRAEDGRAHARTGTTSSVTMKNIGRGHGGAADLQAQAAYVGAIKYSFLAKQSSGCRSAIRCVPERRARLRQTSRDRDAARMCRQRGVRASKCERREGRPPDRAACIPLACAVRAESLASALRPPRAHPRGPIRLQSPRLHHRPDEYGRLLSLTRGPPPLHADASPGLRPSGTPPPPRTTPTPPPPGRSLQHRGLFDATILVKAPPPTPERTRAPASR